MIINLTPHTIRILSETGITREFESRGCARCAIVYSDSSSIDGVPVSLVTYGKVGGLPDPQEGVYYIVSSLIKSALPFRKDLLVPLDLVYQAQDGSLKHQGSNTTDCIVVGCRRLGR
jgi:hypothetical protein